MSVNSPSLGGATRPFPYLLMMYSGLVYQSSPQTKGQSLRTNDSTALCEGNVTIGDDGGFPQRIDF